ncbi:MAG: TonB-dependent receptor [Planctomycetes bacterium]|nr:TonB-dependent receptor [Planctomycetota bacterium]
MLPALISPALLALAITPQSTVPPASAAPKTGAQNQAPDGNQAPEVGETLVEAPRAKRTATASGISHQTIDAEELAATGERSLPRALARTTGLFVQETNLGGGSPILRGMIGNQILIVVDGVRLNDAATRGGPNQSLNGIDMASVERVEVIRGPASVLYGSDALGGTILIWTKHRAAAVRGSTQAGLRGELFAEYQSMVTGASGGLGLSVGGERDALLGIGSLHDWNDLESGSGPVDNTGYHGLGWFGAYEHALGPKRWFRVAASRTRDFEVPRSDRMNVGFGQTNPSDAENFFMLQDRQRTVLSYTDEESGFTDAMQLRLSLREYDEQRQIRRFNNATRALEQDQTTTVGLGADWRKAVGDSQLFTFGFDVDHDDVDSTKDNLDTGTGVITPSTGNFAPESQYWSSGVFLQDEIFAFDPLDVTAGVRYSHFQFSFEDFTTGDKVDADFDALTGSLELAADLAQGVRISGTLAQAFRAPNLSEVARNATFAGGTELANADLDPEQSLYQELALDLWREGWNASIGVYHNAVSDVIGRVLVNDPTPGVPGDETYRRENTGDLEYVGLELRARARLGGSRSPYYAGTSLEYTRGEQDDNILGQDPASKVPPLHGSVFAGWEDADPLGLLSRTEFSLLWADSQDRLSPADLSDPRVDPNGTDGWVTLNLDFGGSLGPAARGTRWHAGVHNLLDESYRIHGSGIDAPGINAVVGFSAQF